MQGSNDCYEEKSKAKKKGRSLYVKEDSAY